MPSDSHRDRDRDRKDSRKRSRKDRDHEKESEEQRHRKSSRKNHESDKPSRKSDHQRRRERSSSSSTEPNPGSRQRKRSKHDRKRSSNDEPKSTRKDKKDRKRKASTSRKEEKCKMPPRKLVDIGPIRKSPPTILLDPINDYFAYHDHLRLLLYRTEGTYFEDLSSIETHKAFAKFCLKYNKGKLERGFYQTELPQDALEQCKRTKHSWNFNTSAAEIKSLNVIKSGVKKQTSYDVKPSSSTTTVKGPMPRAPVHDGLGAEYSSSRAVVPPRHEEKEDVHVSQQEVVLNSLGLGLRPGQKIKIAPRKNI